MFELKTITEALESSWGADTAYDRNEWSLDNKARGQCVVSSLVVQDYLGGELVKCSVKGESISETHYFNKLADGAIIDTTKGQYTDSVVMKPQPVSYDGFTSIRQKRLSDDDTRERYELLKSRVDAYLTNVIN